MLGRLSAPLFLFCLAEGFRHTHDRRRYFAKVYGIHLLMSGLLFLMMCGVLPVRPDGFYPMNGMMTSFVILMVVFQGIDWLGEKRWLPGLAAVVLPLAWPILAGLLMGSFVVEKIFALPVREKIARMKYVEEENVKSYLDAATDELESSMKELVTGEVSA